jgi:hypothetical protein
MRVEFEYERGGALAYMAAWDVRCAKVFGRCETTTGIKPFGRLVHQIMEQEPYRKAHRVFWIMAPPHVPVGVADPKLLRDDARHHRRTPHPRKKSIGLRPAVVNGENYQEWCRQHHLPPFASKKFPKTVKAEVEINLGLRYRHDLEGLNGKAMRGWKGLVLVEAGGGEQAEKGSIKSAA